MTHGGSHAMLIDSLNKWIAISRQFSVNRD